MEGSKLMKFIKCLEGITPSGKKRKKVVIDLSRFKATEEMSVEEQLDEMKALDDLGMVFKLILNKIEFELDVDNNGIGEFDYGSAREFDAGEDYISIDGNDTRVSALIVLGEVSSLAARNLLRDSCLAAERTLYHKDLTLDIKLSPVLSYEGKGFISYKVGVKEV